MRNHETRSRLNTREIIKDCIDPEAWTERERIVQELQAKLMANDLQNHVLLQSLGGGEIDLELQKFLHLEFASAFSRPFTDMLLHAMLDTAELRAEQGPKAQMSARFLLGLNLFEELGFTLDPQSEEDVSTPLHSHYIQYVLKNSKEQEQSLRPLLYLKAQQ